jgi:hypothetical protein
MLSQTLQGALLSITSNVLAQGLSAYKDSVRNIPTCFYGAPLADLHLTDALFSQPWFGPQVCYLQHCQQPTQHPLARTSRRSLPDERCLDRARSRCQARQAREDRKKHEEHPDQIPA